MQVPPQLRLSDTSLATVRVAVRDQLQEGLARDGARVRALPTFLSRPRAQACGDAYVIDVGGSNIRGARVLFRDDAPPQVTMGATAKLPLHLSLEDFLRVHVDVLSPVRVTTPLPLGYCFSYPATPHENGDATVLPLTKGVSVAGLEGARVGSLVSAALQTAGVATSRCTVMNDTVASLFAQHARDPGRRNVGLIVGTGTNMAAFFAARDAWKLGFEQAVNLESGACTFSPQTDADAHVDATSENPGAQSFEKAVSGRYLPRIVAAVLGDSRHRAAQSAEGVFATANDEADPQQHLALAIIERSADLVAAGLDACLDLCAGPDGPGVLAEGGVFWAHARYVSRVHTRLQQLGHALPAFAPLQHANLLGAATAALSQA